VVWLNPFFGDIKIGKDGFENLKIYHETVDSIRGIVHMPKPSGALFERDFAEMQAKHLTFEEAVKSTSFDLMKRQRLTQIWRKYREAIDQAGLI
jgi:hypothetical protein